MLKIWSDNKRGDNHRQSLVWVATHPKHANGKPENWLQTYGFQLHTVVKIPSSTSAIEFLQISLTWCNVHHASAVTSADMIHGLSSYSSKPCKWQTGILNTIQ